MRLVQAIVLVFCLVGSVAHGAEKPNIILLLADDLGWGDLSCYGGTAVQTPHLDALAEGGTRFDRFYAAAPVCSPTRASIMTGQYPLRYNIHRHFNDREMYLPAHIPNLPKLLKTGGYKTAHVGKWHLGGLNQKHINDRENNIPGPLQHGFDEYLTQLEDPGVRAALGRERRLFRDGGKHLVRNDVNEPPVATHYTDINGDQAVAWIEKFGGMGHPFFINVWFVVPHKPYEPAPKPHWEGTGAEGISDDQHRFRSMMAHMDAQVGKIMAKLREMGLADNTLVVFTSDNGAAFEGDVLDLKGGKTDLHEGGIRVPMIAHWPGVIPAGVKTDAVGHSNDLLPTFCEAAGVRLPPYWVDKIDGVSLLGHLKNGAAFERGTLFWESDLYKGLQRHYPKPKPYATEVVMSGKWKLLAYKGEPVELFDLSVDRVEQSNLLDANPEIVAKLRGELEVWLSEGRWSGKWYEGEK
jgi:arylsulfatase A-like enzyme